MEAIIRPDKDGACLLTARLIASALRSKPDLVLGLATGRTMERVYEMLAAMHRQEGLDFSGCRTFNLDEYVGLSGDEQTSYRFYMNQHLFSKINIKPENTHLPNGKAEDLAAECARYEEKIARSGGIDFQLLGIGQDGHIGFNEPLSALRSRTRVKALSPDTIRQNAQFFSSPANMPRRAITMGVGTILESKRCVLLATGEAKAAIIAKAVEGPITSMISASALQLHPHCTIIVDEAAALKLERIDYYRWVFVNEPEWQEYISG
ncbi:MAG: glucosamine-6-phosphate deaminase [Kiritimatiellae bacterium]|nr:glucosamine-6-phosphate deaminase [Kiritimatiellia bacterium]